MYQWPWAAGSSPIGTTYLAQVSAKWGRDGQPHKHIPTPSPLASPLDRVCVESTRGIPRG